MYETEADRLAALQARVDTINRAISFIELTGDGCAHILRQVGVREQFQDPAEMVTILREATQEGASTGHRFGAWKAAQRICRAAGLKY